jgi:ubiquinone/menaquinone biosynthesis C-methylase UbiE
LRWGAALLSPPLARAARKARRIGLDLQLDRGFANQLPYPEASFDRVLSALMFHHLDVTTRVKALREMLRVLRSGGSLLVRLAIG